MMTGSFNLRLVLKKNAGIKPAPTGTRAPVGASFMPAFFSKKLPQVKVDFDVQRHINGNAVPHAGAESPLFKRLNGIFIEAESEAAHNAKNVACTIFADDRFKNDCSLIARLASLFGILRLDALNNA